MPTIRRSARSTSTTRTRSPSRRSRRRSPPASRARISSAWSTRSSRPTPPDHADILLPATTQLEHDGHPQFVRPPVRAGQQRRDRAARRSEAQHRGLPPARRAHGFRRALLPRQRRRPRRGRRYDASHPRAAGIDWDSAASRRASQRLAVPASYAPFAHGNFPTPSGKCEFFSATLAAAGPRSAADVRAAARIGRHAIPRLRSAIRSRSCRRRRAIS